LLQKRLGYFFTATIIVILVLVYQNFGIFTSTINTISSSSNPIQFYPKDPNCPSASINTQTTDVNANLKEFGIIFFDANTNQCSQTAAQILYEKTFFLTENPGSLQGWLEGALIEMIAVDAMLVSAHGFFNGEMDRVVRAAFQKYTGGHYIEPGLASFSNNRFDDYSQEAPAYAWMATYSALSGRSADAKSFADLAEGSFTNAFSLSGFFCVDPTKVQGVPPDESVRAETSAALTEKIRCSDIADSQTGLASSKYAIISSNHQFENIGYGLGLMTSFSSAALGLQIAGHPHSPSDVEKAIATALWGEGQLVATSSGDQFITDCYNLGEIQDPSFGTKPFFVYGRGCISSGQISCADSGYTPNIFPVRKYYEDLQLNIPSPVGAGYQFNTFNEGAFGQPFLSEGRQAVYGYLAYYWRNPPGSPHPLPALAGYTDPPSLSTQGNSNAAPTIKLEPKLNNSCSRSGSSNRVNQASTIDFAFLGLPMLIAIITRRKK